MSAEARLKKLRAMFAKLKEGLNAKSRRGSVIGSATNRRVNRLESRIEKASGHPKKEKRKR